MSNRTSRNPSDNLVISSFLAAVSGSAQVFLSRFLLLIPNLCIPFQPESQQQRDHSEQQTWQEVESRMYFLEFPSNRAELQNFFTNALSHSNPALEEFKLPSNIQQQIDSTLSLEQPVHAEVGPTSELASQHQSDEYPSQVPSIHHTPLIQQNNVNDHSPASLSAKVPIASVPTEGDPALAQLLYKYFELGYLTCQYQVCLILSFIRVIYM